VEPPTRLEGIASGDVIGLGRWQFAEQGGVTAVRYEWNVRTAKPVMNLLAPFSRPLIKWNHDQIMRDGGKGLARLLGGRLLEISHN
jgi:hypothetical protein